MKDNQQEVQEIEQYQSQIQSFFQNHSQKSFNAKQVLKRLGLQQELSLVTVKRCLEILEAEGFISQTKIGYYRWAPQHITFRGILHLSKGKSTVVLLDSSVETDEQHLELELLHGDKVKAFSGDEVEVCLIHKRKGTFAKVVSVLKHNRVEFTGIIQAIKFSYFFIADDKTIRTDFYIPRKYLNGGSDGMRVIARFLNWESIFPEVEIIEVLGPIGEHQAEMHAIIRDFGLKTTFSAESIAEANTLPDEIPTSEINRRKDFRSVLTFTIDPIDAKDFDDALSFRVLPNGNYEVGVHIADVTYFLTAGSALDKEAAERATSVYLVDRTIPMLPERLSNHLCSLVPNQDRLTFSAVFELNPNAEIISEWFGRTIIHSVRRFTYEEV
ncbi:MAG: RNB domain-containing ribonuclease, partial [Bacteroidia bacterium]|nr:RNB domain-containing ribonuclease [Bacteroidia bacterium]